MNEFTEDKHAKSKARAVVSYVLSFVQVLAGKKLMQHRSLNKPISTIVYLITQTSLFLWTPFLIF